VTAEIDMSEVDRLVVDFDQHAELIGKLSSDALSDIASTLRDDARSAAPVESGALRDSIKLRGGAGYRVVYTTVRYARFVEFGTSTMGPRPFLWPAASKAEQALLDALDAAADPLG
jgi:HK97 gp10 family phage protein